MSSPDLIFSYLKDFDAFAKKYPGPLADSILLGESGPLTTITLLIHGDEVGPLRPVIHFLEKLEQGFGLKNQRLCFALGNRQAAEQGVRYIKWDLNRIFHRSEDSCYELKRAQDLRRLLDQTDLYLDFHQTIQPSLAPFFIMASERQTAAWVKKFPQIRYWMTHVPSESFSEESLCSDEYVQRRSKPALSIEFWQKGFSQKVDDLVEAVLEQLMSELVQPDGTSEDGVEPERFRIRYRQPLLHEDNVLIPGLKNLQIISQKDILGYTANGDPICSPLDGLLLFPKYPKKEMPGGSLADSIFVVACLDKR